MLLCMGSQRVGHDRADLLQNGLVGSPCSSRDSQESSPTPQFKSMILRCLAFLIVQLSHPYITTGKTIALTHIHISYQFSSVQSLSCVRLFATP